MKLPTRRPVADLGMVLGGAKVIAWPYAASQAGLMALASAFAATPARLEAAFKSRKKTQ